METVIFVAVALKRKGNWAK